MMLPRRTPYRWLMIAYFAPAMLSPFRRPRTHFVYSLFSAPIIFR